MANNNGPFGFRQQDMTAGVSANFGLKKGQMAYNASACFEGDPLVMSGGNLAQAGVTGGGAAIAGFAKSFSWISVAQKQRTYSNYWPGNDCASGQTVEVYYDLNPQAIYLCQCAAGPVTQSSVGKFANYSAGSGGNTANGISSYSLDDSTITTSQGSLPLVIVGIVEAPKSDPTSAYNLVAVQVVNQQPGV